MALSVLRVLVLGVLAAAGDDVPVTWRAGPRAELVCVVPEPAPGVGLRRPPALLEEDRPNAIGVTWRRGGAVISTKRVLEVKEEGVYQCSTLQHGGVVLGLPINLKFASISQQFSKHPENAKARAGQPHAVSCEIQSAPPASLTWLRDGSPLPTDKRYYNLPHQLLILDVKKEDAGVFVCIARSYGQNRTSHGGALQVEDSSEDLEPGMLPVYQEEHLVVPLGSRVVLPCPLLGWPRPTLIWEFTSPGERRAESEFTGEVLVIPSIQLDQEGFYSCLVEGNSALVKNFNVTLTTPVVITEPPAQNRTVTRSVHRAGTIRFNCTAAGRPAPAVYWYKDGVPVPREKIRTNRDKQQLVISGATSEDAGIYECVAQSAGGAAAAWAALGVLGAAAEAPRGVSCRPLGARAVHLAWTRTHHNESYYVQYTAKPVTRMPHYNNEEVIPLPNALTPYMFKVRAFVAVSQTHKASDLSAEVICQGQGVPIQLIQKYSDTVMISWEQFATSNPGVVEWILQYRNSSDNNQVYDIKHDRDVYNYTLNVVKSASRKSRAYVRVLGSRSKKWPKQDLSLVPWTSTVDTDSDDRESLPVPSNVTVSQVGAHSLVVKWSEEGARGDDNKGTGAEDEGAGAYDDEGAGADDDVGAGAGADDDVGAGAGAEEDEGAAGAGYVYEVCVRSMEGDDICQESNTNTLHISDLEEETEYEVRVRSKDAVGSQTSEFSAPRHFTTLSKNGIGQLYYMWAGGALRVWWAGSGRCTVHYSSELKLPIRGWNALDTAANSVQITDLDPTRETFVMVYRHDSGTYSNILTVPAQTHGPDLHNLTYDYSSTEIKAWWNAGPLRFVKYSQNLTLPMEEWRRVNVTDGSSILLKNVNTSLPTYVSVSVSESQWHSGVVAVLTIPPRPATSMLYYIVPGVIVGVIALLLTAVGAWLWRRRKLNRSPLRLRRNTGTKSNQEDGSELKQVGGRLANGGASLDAGEPLLNGHVHIIENPTSKTPNGKLKRGRLEAFDVSRHEDHDVTAETTLEPDTSAPASNFLDTSRTEQVSKSSRVSSNNSFPKLPDDNMNSERTRSTDIDLESSKIQPTLQPNG